MEIIARQQCFLIKTVTGQDFLQRANPRQKKDLPVERKFTIENCRLTDEERVDLLKKCGVVDEDKNVKSRR